MQIGKVIKSQSLKVLGKEVDIDFQIQNIVDRGNT